MLPIFESILPVFLIVVLGAAFKRWPLIPVAMWDGLERFGYYVLFPSLLFSTLKKADFTSLETGGITVAALGMVAVITILLFALWPMLRKFGFSSASYTSIFQTTSRWNGFVALAIAQKLYGNPGMEVVAYVMTIIVLPLNLINVGMLLWYTGVDRSFSAFLRQITRNPLIIGCLLGVSVNLAGVPIYRPVMDTVDMIARTSLPLGLLMLGAGLRISDALKPQPIALWPLSLKLILTPILAVGIGIAMGLNGITLMALCVCGAVPTAMNGYLLAKQMGGDAPLYAAVATIQTVAAFFTIPLMLYLTAQFAG